MKRFLFLVTLFFAVSCVASADRGHHHGGALVSVGGPFGGVSVQTGNFSLTLGGVPAAVLVDGHVIGEVFYRQDYGYGYYDNDRVWRLVENQQRHEQRMVENQQRHEQRMEESRWRAQEELRREMQHQAEQQQREMQHQAEQRQHEMQRAQENRERDRQHRVEQRERGRQSRHR